MLTRDKNERKVTQDNSSQSKLEGQWFWWSCIHDLDYDPD